MRPTLLLLGLVPVLLAPAPAHAASGYFTGEVVGVIQNTCGPASCSVAPLTPPWRACSEQDALGNGSLACSGDLWASIAPTGLAGSGCSWWSGTGSVTFTSALAGGTWTVPVTSYTTYDLSRSYYKGTLNTGTAVVRVEGAWTNHCTSFRGQFGIWYEIVKL